MSKHLGAPALLEVGSSDIDQIDPPLPEDVRARLVQAIACFFNNTLSFEATGSSQIIDKLKEIIDISDDPQTYKDQLMNSLSDDPEASDFDLSSGPKKTKPWSPSEDIRLLAGIYKYGLENWSYVASFVGNGRTRSQASQRWSRGLNPRISKDAWTADEDQALMRLVQEFGDKAWTKVASHMGNRSDVQCRYHYNQIAKASSSRYNLNPCFQYQENSVQYNLYPRSTPSILPDKIISENKQNRTISPHFNGINYYQKVNQPRLSSNPIIMNHDDYLNPNFQFNRNPITSNFPSQYQSSSSTDSDLMSSPNDKEHATRFLAEQRVASELRVANQSLFSSISRMGNAQRGKPKEQKTVPQNVPRSQPIPRIQFAGPQDLQQTTINKLPFIMNQNDLHRNMNNFQPQSQPQPIKKDLNNSYQNQESNPFASMPVDQNSSPPPPPTESNQNPFSIDNFLQRFRH